MAHDNVPFHDARDGQARFQPLERREQSSFGGQAQYADTTGSSIQPGWEQYPPPNQPAIPGIDRELVEHGQIIGHAYAGPVPPPSIIDGCERIQAGLGKRILDDAHDDTVADREITRKAFDHAIWEAQAGFIVATFISMSAIVGIVLCLVFLDPPESLAGAGILGLASLTPLVRTFLNRDQQKSSADQPFANPNDVEKQAK